MLDDVGSVLRAAVGTGEIISIAYHGGSQPGTRRDIVVLRVDEDRVFARCLDAGGFRLFLFDRMAIATGNEPAYVAGKRRTGTRLKTRREERMPIEEHAPAPTPRQVGIIVRIWRYLFGR